MAYDLPDLVAKLRIDTSDLNTAAARASASMSRVSDAASNAVKDLPDKLGKVGEDSGDSLGEGIKRRSSKAIGETSESLKQAFAKAGADAGGKFGDGFYYDADLRLRNAAGQLATRVEAINKDHSVRLKVDLDDAPARRSLSRLGSALDQTERRLSTFGSGLTNIGIGAGIGVLAQQAVSLTAALAPAVGIVAALPGALSAVGAAGATAAVGLNGMGAAFKAIADGDPAKIAEAMGKLAPSARAFVTETVGIGKAFDPIRQVVQERLFDGLDVSLRNLATASLPTLRTGMSDVAESLNGVARAALSATATPLFQGAMATVFATTTTATNQFAGAVGPLTTGLANLAAAASPVILRFTEFVNKGLGTAGAFLSTQEGAAKMTAVMQRAGDVLSSVFSIGVNLGKALGGIFSASGSEGYLAALERITAKFAEWTKSAEGQEQLRTLFSSLSEIAGHLGTVLVTVGSAILKVFQAVNGLPGPVKDTVLQMVAWSLAVGLLIKGLSGASVAVKGLIGVAGGVKKVLAGAAEGSAKMAVAIRNTGPAVSAAATKVGEFGKTALNVARFAADIAVAWVKMAAAAVANAVKTAGAWALTNGAAMVKAVASMVIAAGSVVAGWVVMGVQSLIGAGKVALAWIIAMGPIALAIAAVVGLVILIVKNWDTIKEATSKVWSAISGFITDAWDAITEFVSKAVGAIADYVVGKWNSLRDTTMAVYNALKDAITNAWDAIYAAVSKVVRTVVDFVVERWNNLKANTLLVFNAVKDVVTGVWDAIWATVSRVVRAVVDFVLERWENLKTNTVNAFNAVKDVVTGVWDRVRDAVSGAVSRVRELISDAWNFVKEKTSVAWNAVKGAVTDGVRGVVDVVSDLPARLLRGLGKIGDLLLNVGRDIVDGLKRGIEGAWRFVTDTIRRLVDGIAGPVKKLLGISSPSKVFAKIGRNIAEGLALGITAATGMVTDAVTGLSKELPSYVDGDIGNLSVSAGRMTGNGGASATAAMPNSTGASYTVNLPLVPYTAEQVGREAVQQLRNMELAQL